MSQQQNQLKEAELESHWFWNGLNFDGFQKVGKPFSFLSLRDIIKIYTSKPVDFLN